LNTIPSWQGLLAELAGAPLDPVPMPRKPSMVWPWLVWLIPTGLMFVPVVMSFYGQKLPAEITEAFPWILIPILLVSGLIVGMMATRSLRSQNADLALFGFTMIEPTSKLTRFTGEYQLVGRRHGRPVSVVIERPTRRIGASVVRVAAPSPSFELVGQGIQLFAKPGPSAALLGLLATICPSGLWDGVTVHGGPEGILVRRPALWTAFPSLEIERRWLYDLWLAEHLAAALTAHR
jgi:hypothetical protein